MVTTAIYKVLSIYLYIPSHVTTGLFPLVGLEVSETGRKKFFFKTYLYQEKGEVCKNLAFSYKLCFKVTPSLIFS